MRGEGPPLRNPPYGSYNVVVGSNDLVGMTEQTPALARVLMPVHQTRHGARALVSEHTQLLYKLA